MAKPHFVVVIHFWRGEPTQMRLAVTDANRESDAVLLKQILSKLTPAQLRVLGTVSVAQIGGRAVPWLAEFLRENPNYEGGYKWNFGVTAERMKRSTPQREWVVRQKDGRAHGGAGQARAVPKKTVLYGRHTVATISKGNPGWTWDVRTRFGGGRFLDANGTIYKADAIEMATADMAKWDREIDNQGGPEKWR